MPETRIVFSELTAADLNAVCGGQANNITIDESSTATSTRGSAALFFNAPSGTFSVSLNTAPGLATISFSARQSGS
jgi:hypothetical protein